MHTLHSHLAGVVSISIVFALVVFEAVKTSGLFDDVPTDSLGATIGPKLYFKCARSTEKSGIIGFVVVDSAVVADDATGSLNSLYNCNHSY